ncbi:MAG: CoA-binding protein [Syntrophales bacterium]
MGDLQKIFNSRTVAVIGATDREGSFGRAVLENALTSSNRTVYPVNAHRETVLDKACWPDIGSVPEEIDLAIIATPAATVPGVVEACGRAGVGGLIIISAGFQMNVRPSAPVMIPGRQVPGRSRSPTSPPRVGTGLPSVLVPAPQGVTKIPWPYVRPECGLPLRC